MDENRNILKEAFDRFRVKNLRHQRFLELYLQKGEGMKSYLAVYPDTKKDAAMASASRLLATEKIRSCVDYVRDAMIKPSVASIEELRERLTAIIRGEEAVSDASRIRAFDILARMSGAYNDRPAVDAQGAVINILSVDPVQAASAGVVNVRAEAAKAENAAIGLEV